MTPSPPPANRAVLHRLRSPLTAIMGMAEVLTRSAERGTLTPERLVDRLAHIRAAADRINTLLNELDPAPDHDRPALGSGHPAP